MAAHLRKQIREAVAAAVTNLTTTSTRVFQSRVYPLQDSNLPALLVWTRSEDVGVVSIHGHRLLRRVLRIEITGVAKATSDLDDTLDQIAKEVEIALAPPVSGLVPTLAKDIVLRTTDITIDGEAEKPTGRLRMTYEAEYYTADNTPDTVA